MSEEQTLRMPFTERIPTLGVITRWLNRLRPFVAVTWNHLACDAEGRAVSAQQSIAKSATKEAARNSEERLRTIIDAEPECVKLLAADCTLLEMNPAGLSMIEADSPEQVLGKSVLGLIDKDYRSAFQELTDRVFQGNRATLEFRITGLKGRSRWLETHAAPLKNSNGEIEACLGITRDITEHKIAMAERDRAEQTLRLSEEKFEKAFRSSPVAITISTCAEGRYLEVNDAFLGILGYQRTEILGQTAGDLNVWVDTYERDKMLRELTQNGRISGMQTRFRTRNGETRRIELAAELVELDGLSCVLAISCDVTERLRLEQQFLHAQRMEAVGRLAAGVAHDFNNILSVIIGRSQLSEEQLNPTHTVNKHVIEIKKAAQRAATLTKQLLAFSRQQIAYSRVLDLNAVVTDMRQMLTSMVGEDVAIAMKPEIALGSIRGDEGQLEQVVMNLVVNARDAMPHGGRIVIETSNATLDNSYTRLHPDVEAGSYVMLSVSDEGCGMDAETKSHIFEPFFTTKGPGHGTGLGLSTVHGIVKEIGGHISVYSESDKGTTFKIYLPRVDEPAEALAEPCADEKADGGSETILVVEDDDSLRDLTLELLSQSGYRVLAAEHGTEAIRVAEQHQGEIDLLLTDVIMPGMSGGELSSRLRSFKPQLRVLYASGYKGDLVVRHGGLSGDVVLLEKPFTKNCLLAKVRQVLQGTVVEPGLPLK